MDKFIYEVVIYDGGLKVWKVMNITTGSLYSFEYNTFEEAEASIEDGKGRVGKVVKRVSLSTIQNLLSDNQKSKVRIINGKPLTIHAVTVPIGVNICNNTLTGKTFVNDIVINVDAIWGLNGSPAWCWGNDGKGNLTHYTLNWSKCLEK